jgi:hypothetical protein
LSNTTNKNGIKFSGKEKLFKVVLPRNIESIEDNTFLNCNKLEYITSFNTNPPSVANNLGINTDFCTLFIPKEAFTNYGKHHYWSKFINIETLDPNYYKKISIKTNLSSDNDINHYYYINDTIKIAPPSIDGYHFIQWSDGNTENPRTIVVTQDSTFTAEFEINQYKSTLDVDNTMGRVVGAGTYNHGETITIMAIANEGYNFTQWSDGDINDIRDIIITQDTTLTAEFKVASTPIENTSDNQTKIYTTNNTIYIKGATSDYHVLDAAGRLIYTGNASTLQLPRGIYLITIDGEVEKIIL